MSPSPRLLRFSTDMLPERGRFHAFREGFARQVLNVDWLDLSAGSPRFELTFLDLGGVGVGSLVGTAGEVIRNARQARDGTDQFLLCLIAEGRHHLQHAGHDHPCDVGSAMFIDHARPHCASREVYKGILGDHARAVFNGKIIVRPDAQKTDAKQTNKALLLSEDAQINTKPQLEIFANDVKCTHGAAIGQMDDEAIFYLRARGLGAQEARRPAAPSTGRRASTGLRNSARCGRRLLKLPGVTVIQASTSTASPAGSASRGATSSVCLRRPESRSPCTSPSTGCSAPTRC